MSTGAVMNTSALIAGYFTFKAGLPLPLAMLLSIIIGTLFGMLNGALITKAHINPFVTTLATQMIAVGLGSSLQRFKRLTIHCARPPKVGTNPSSNWKADSRQGLSF